MVSIIIPIYNVEKYITACLESVVAQTYTDYEVILVDDCGTDGSMRLVEEFIHQNENQNENSKLYQNINKNESVNENRFRIVRHHSNRGLSAARNTGTEAAKGEYIYYLDSDDTITPDCLELLVKEAERTEAEIVVGGIHVIGDDRWIPTLKKNNTHCDKDCFHSYLQGDYYMMAWNKLIRRDFIERNDITFVEGLIHEDCAWSFSVACKLRKVAFVYDETYNYLIRNNSIQTGKDYTKHFNAYCSLLKYYVSEARKFNKDNDPVFRWWLERQKAQYFGQTLHSGTKEQLYEIYSIIRENLPMKGRNKMLVHYRLPAWLGILAYKKWHGMWLV